MKNPIRTFIFGPDDRSIRSFLDDARDVAAVLLATGDRDDGPTCLATARAIETILEDNDAPA